MISKENAEKLERAYKKLYAILVRVYLHQNKTNGQSWHNAIGDMDKILNVHNAEKETNPVIRFLFELFKSHKSTVAKKCMKSPNRYNVVSVKKSYTSGELQTAILKFEQIIKVVTQQSVTSSHQAETPNILPTMPIYGRAQPFYDWIEKTIDPADIEKLEADPRQLEILYNKYIKQQKHR